MLILFLVAIEYFFTLAAMALSQVWGLGLYATAGVTLAFLAFISIFTKKALEDQK